MECWLVKLQALGVSPLHMFSYVFIAAFSQNTSAQLTASGLCFSIVF